MGSSEYIEKHPWQPLLKPRIPSSPCWANNTNQRLNWTTSFGTLNHIVLWPANKKTVMQLIYELFQTAALQSTTCWLTSWYVGWQQPVMCGFCFLILGGGKNQQRDLSRRRSRVVLQTLFLPSNRMMSVVKESDQSARRMNQTLLRFHPGCFLAEQSSLQSAKGNLPLHFLCACCTDRMCLKPLCLIAFASS